MANVVALGQVTGPRRLGLLPTQATGFVGREDELACLATLLRTSRLVTVAGPAGVGKTRLALRAAAEAAGRYRDGVWLVDLGGTDDPGQVAGAVAAALGVTAGDEAGWPPVLGHLRRRELLLILDTCEHLVDACGEFADTVLRGAPGVTLIVTSRQPLDVPGEHAFPLLPLPPDGTAVELFAQRAAAVVPGFSVTPGNRADIVRLCRRLDGIPLAIEFAAVRLRALPLPELTSQLESGIRTLTVSRRGTSPRHQTLRAAIDWSYQLCGPAERTLWERLSVFAGTFDVSGAEYVCADGRLPRQQVVPALVGLVDKSVVLRDRAAPSRYRLLGALREFGADRLAETGGANGCLTGSPPGRWPWPGNSMSSSVTAGAPAPRQRVAGRQTARLVPARLKRCARCAVSRRTYAPRSVMRSARSSRARGPGRRRPVPPPGCGLARTSRCGCPATGRSAASSRRAGSGSAGWPGCSPSRRGSTPGR